ncbi:MAG: hypothetical protein A2687_01545 [Candidatus Levybacteria bacterium RIFCSPHIGHO2_01_FULL_38_26]|nr:MAG: hypothetical protein A2687_01545 [Candidatus Levybacteria bacterium RIFCSPHIGHO2_01_FULL_38_26]
MKHNSKVKEPFLFVYRYKNAIIFGVLFFLLLYLRFYELETRSPFGWDQVNNAWAAQRIIVNHDFPLLGFQAKLNSGIYIGPLYYYFISIFYTVTNLDPIASGIAAGVTSIFTFLTLFYVTKKLFSINTALVAVFIYTVGFFGIMFDRSQGPINFIPATSLLIFYSLYNVLRGKPKYLLLLGLALGFSVHVHISSIYYPIIILLSLPFFPKSREMIKNAVLSFFVFVIFLIPNIIVFLQNAGNVSAGLGYGQTYYHGFHLRRVLQLLNDAFIQFESILTFQILKFLKFVIPPLFIFVYLFKSATREKILFCYLVILWYLVPWFVLATYSGEISDYYFSTNRFIGIVIISYLLVRLFHFKNWAVRISLLCFLLFYAYFNITKFLSLNEPGLNLHRQTVLKAISEGRRIEFGEGVPESYLYYYYMRKEGKKVY